MSHTAHYSPADNLRGAALMVAAMACFAIEDSLIKSTAKGFPVGEIILAFGVGGMLVYALLTLRRGEKLFPREALSGVMLTRSGFEVMGRLFFTLSITLGSLTASSAILQATPIVVTAVGALLWREHVGRLRWALILLGFAGVIMVIRPAPESFSALSILAVLGMLGLAGRDLATRAAPASLSYAQLGFYGFAALPPAAILLLVMNDEFAVPTLSQSVFLLAIVVVGVTAYTCLTFAMRMGALSVVTPFRYARLPFGVAMAMMVFGEQPDAWEIMGGAVIVVAGLGIMLTSRR